jgi:hypothetical protein
MFHMAFRIHDSVVRGEIDNRVKGTVRGKIWLEGRTKPVTLQLKGNAWPDLAGCVLKFMNSQKCVRHPDLDSLHTIQKGTVGDITASRKVRVFDVLTEEAYMMSKRGKKPPEHMANCLYLEWFSESNGRVVIESTDYILEISAPQWRLTPEEDAERAKLAADGMNIFLQRLTEAVEKHQRGQKDPEEKWNEHDYEKFLKESDARNDKYRELLEKYGDSDEAQEKIAREMGWIQEMTEEEAKAQQEWIEEANRACEEALNEPPPEPEPHREGIDWVRTKDGRTAHPLQYRCSKSALKFWKQARQAGMEKLADKDLDAFIFEFQTTAAKLAGSLNGVAEGRSFSDGAFTVAYLKRALNHLHKSQAGLEAIAQKKILSSRAITEAREELFEIREGILKLMDEFRGRQSG